jgi:hypothetical protein
MKKRFPSGALVFCLWLVLLLAACGKTEEATPTAAPVVTTVASNVRTTTTTRTSNNNTTVATAGGSSDLTAVRAEKDVVRTFTDAQGRTIKLVYGRGTGHQSDYGWAHIMGKHLNGIWYDGGTLTTFPQAVGAKTPQAVLDLVAKSLQDPNPDNQGNGRRGYNYAVPGTNKDIFTVVGSDGTIITSYPVPHGSKDLND